MAMDKADPPTSLGEVLPARSRCLPTSLREVLRAGAPSAAGGRAGLVLYNAATRLRPASARQAATWLLRLSSANYILVSTTF